MVEGHGIFIDTEHVRRAEVGLIVLLGDSIAPISATILPGVVLGLPIVCTVPIPVALLLRSWCRMALLGSVGRLFARASLFGILRSFGGRARCVRWSRGRSGLRRGGPILRLGRTSSLF